MLYKTGRVGCVVKIATASGILEGLERVRTNRWISDDRKRLYEWDNLHGHIEVYNERGYHLGIAEPIKGELIGKAIKGRKIDI